MAEAGKMVLNFDALLKQNHKWGQGNHEQDVKFNEECNKERKLDALLNQSHKAMGLKHILVLCTM